MSRIYLQIHTLPYHTLPHTTLPYHTLPHTTLPNLTLPHTTLPYQTLPHTTLPYHTFPHTTLPSHTLPHSTLPYHTFPQFHTSISHLYHTSISHLPSYHTSISHPPHFHITPSHISVLFTYTYTTFMLSYTYLHKKQFRILLNFKIFFFNLRSNMFKFCNYTWWAVVNMCRATILWWMNLVSVYLRDRLSLLKQRKI